MLRFGRILFKEANPLIISKRLPKNDTRKQRILPTTMEAVDAPPIVAQIERAASDRVRSVRVWDILAKAVLLERDSLLPQHVSDVLRAFSKVGYRNIHVTNEFIDSLCDCADMKSMVSGMIALQKLNMPTHRLQFAFMNSLQGNTEGLSFVDLRFILVALARLNVRNNLPLLTEVASNMVSAAYKQEGAGYVVDSREFLVVPFIVGKLQFYHDDLLELTFKKLGGLTRSRIPAAPMDCALCLEGWLRMSSKENKEFEKAKERVSTYLKFVFSRIGTEKLLDTGAGFATVGVQHPEVWNLWADEIEGRIDLVKEVSQLSALVDLFVDLGRPTQKLRHRLNQVKGTTVSDGDEGEERFGEVKKGGRRRVESNGMALRDNKENQETEYNEDSLMIPGEMIRTTPRKQMESFPVYGSEGPGEFRHVDETKVLRKRAQGHSRLAALNAMAKKNRQGDGDDIIKVGGEKLE